MSRKSIVVASVVVMLGIAAVLLVKQRQIRELEGQNAVLRAQLSRMTLLQDSNAHLAERLEAAVAFSQTNQNELLRLRGQGVRFRQLEQENAQLKAQRQQLEQQVQQRQAQLISSEQGQGTAVSEAKLPAASPGLDSSTDLGSLELQGGIAVHFDLGGGTNCVITPTALPDGNNVVEIKLGLTNADGTFSQLGASRITARPGQHCSISVGDRMIALAVKLK